MVVVASASFVRANDAARKAYPLTLPHAQAGPSPDAERSAFAERLAGGYGLGEKDANLFAAWILEASTRQRFEPELLASVVMAESGFRKEARSIVGAVGPAQVRPDLWRQVCGGDLYDPEQNIYCAAQILGRYRDACAAESGFGAPVLAEECALRAYNVGFKNRNNVYFMDAAVRYLGKIDRFRAPLAQS